MFCRSLEEIVRRAKDHPRKRRAAVAGAEDPAVLEASLRALDEGLTLPPVLIGDGRAIEAQLEEKGRRGGCEVRNIPAGENPAAEAVSLILRGEADFLVKGKIDTRSLLKPVVDRSNGLQCPDSPSGGLMSHLGFFDIPGRDRLLVLTDGGMVVRPDLMQKRGLILNAVEVLLRLGWERPRVGVLTATEKVNPAIPEAIEAAQLAGMSLRGQIPGCLVEGPVSWDVAMYPEIARLKGYRGRTEDPFDVVVVPDVNSGNLLGKALRLTAGCGFAGIVTGAKAPIVLTSRGAGPLEKFRSIALSALAGPGRTD